MQHPLPWKAVEFPGLQPGQSLWDVTTDAGDPREEYSVTESMGEATSRFIVEACNGYAALKAKCAQLSDDSLALESKLDDWDRAIRDAVAAAGLPPIREPENYEHLWESPKFIRTLAARVRELESAARDLVAVAGGGPDFFKKVNRVKALLNET